MHRAGDRGYASGNVHSGAFIPINKQGLKKVALGKRQDGNWVVSRVSVLLFKMATGICGHCIICVWLVSLVAAQMSSGYVEKVVAVTARQRIPPCLTLSQRPVGARCGWHTVTTTL